MDKFKFETNNYTNDNVARIASLFPGVVAEGKINFDLLRTILGDEIFTDEVYEFMWVGKRDAITEARRPIRKTLRPCPSESKNWDNTENLYIEGDNLDVLKLLQENYLGKVKMIYIDPPYNTGNDFIYQDDFAQSREEYAEREGAFNDGGDRLLRNTESNGRFHSDWCSMLYSRLILSRNLLCSDGLIFISIDDNEQENLKKICNEIFGAENFQAQIIWRKKRGKDNSTTGFSVLHEYLLVYSRKKNISLNRLPMSEKREDIYSNPDNDARGRYVLQPAWASGMKKGPIYSIVLGRHEFKERMWLYAKETLLSSYLEGRLSIKGLHSDGNPNVYLKVYLSENKGIIPDTIWDRVGNTGDAVGEIKSIFSGTIPFSTPKPLSYLKEMLSISTLKDSFILDFFSGSATTAHAVMQLNAEDGGKRKFIMVQLPEVCAEGTEAAKAGYANICEIGKERIRRAGEKIKEEVKSANAQLKLGEEPKQVPDIGFRVLIVDDSNMNDVYYAAGDYTQDMLARLESNIKADRTDLDLLFGCLLDWGLPLSMPHSHETIDSFTVHTYNSGDLVACFEENVSEKAIREIAARKPLRAVFRDSSFTSSPEKINVFEIFKLLAPNTTVRVI